MQQEKINIKSLEESLIENGKELNDEQVKKLIDGNTDKDWQLIIDYIKRGPSDDRLEQILLTINFDFMKSENYDQYLLNKKTVTKLLEEKDGIIDTDKREQAKLLLQSIPRKKPKLLKIK